MNEFERKLEKVNFELNAENREQAAEVPRKLQAGSWKRIKLGVVEPPSPGRDRSNVLNDTFELEEDVRRMREKPK